ncbi:MAG: NADP-dependent oxidoreductase, partial [Primorskyibacter sp.]
MTSYQRIVLAERPKGPPTLANFRIEDQPMPTIAEGEFLVRIIWLSLDPYMRGRMDDGPSYADPVKLGETMTAGAVGEIVASRHPRFSEGTIVVGAFGWCSMAVSTGEGVQKLDPTQAPLSTALGALGMPGHTAWVGLTRILQAQPGETAVISAATGAVGSVAGQLAKLRGLRAVGVAGGAEKCAYATQTLGFDACVDHRAGDAGDLRDALAAAAPDGVDCYFENVGGKTQEAVVPLLNQGGRVAVCGLIAWYSGQRLNEGPFLPALMRRVLVQRLRIQGFIIFDHADSYPEFRA